MGYMAIVYSGESDRIRYLVAENNNKGLVKRILSNLTSAIYITNLYALNRSGLPLRQAAGFPQRVSVEMSRTGMIIITENVPLYIPEGNSPCSGLMIIIIIPMHACLLSDNEIYQYYLKPIDLCITLT